MYLKLLIICWSVNYQQAYVAAASGVIVLRHSLDHKPELVNTLSFCPHISAPCPLLPGKGRATLSPCRGHDCVFTWWSREGRRERNRSLSDPPPFPVEAGPHPGPCLCPPPTLPALESVSVPRDLRMSSPAASWCQILLRSGAGTTRFMHTTDE